MSRFKNESRVLIFGKEFWNRSILIDRIQMSRKKECPGCAMETDIRDDVCPICGYEFPEEPKSMKIAVWVFILLVMLWIFF